MSISLIIIFVLQFFSLVLFARIFKFNLWKLLISLSLIFVFFWSFFYLKIQNEIIVLPLFDWIGLGEFNIKLVLLFDSLTKVMVFVIIIVSSMVICYSFNYMENDPHFLRFISYLFLFTFFMLLLVTANNFLQLLLGWEGVGLSSYLLISFWYTRVAANKAAIKAMSINRIGDICLLFTVCLINENFGSLEFNVVFNNMVYFSDYYLSLFFFNLRFLDLLCFLIFISACGKSAQLILHIWLPDAMEGPTPVSALLHAATMVTAGVFLVIRCSIFFESSLKILFLLVFLGSLTCFVMSFLGAFQQDIKKVVAFSTCSQLGYMFMGCGLSSYNTSFFHLFNHAFFKALLFLSMGIIIHSLSDEQDLRKMGSLVNFFPYTCLLVFFGNFALLGLPFLSGFYSKDVLIEIAFLRFYLDGNFCYFLGLFAVLFTAFYSFRLFFKVFFGYSNFPKKQIKSMLIIDAPLFISTTILLFGTVIVGFFFFDVFLGIGSFFFFDSVFVSFINYSGISVELECMFWGLKGDIILWLKEVFLSIYRGFLKTNYPDPPLSALPGGLRPRSISSIDLNLYKTLRLRDIPRPGKSVVTMSSLMNDLKNNPRTDLSWAVKVKPLNMWFNLYKYYCMIDWSGISYFQKNLYPQVTGPRTIFLYGYINLFFKLWLSDLPLYDSSQCIMVNIVDLYICFEKLNSGKPPYFIMDDFMEYLNDKVQSRDLCYKHGFFRNRFTPAFYVQYDLKHITYRDLELLNQLGGNVQIPTKIINPRRVNIHSQHFFARRNFSTVLYAVGNMKGVIPILHAYSYGPIYINVWARNLVAFEILSISKDSLIIEELGKEWIIEDYITYEVNEKKMSWQILELRMKYFLVGCSDFNFKSELILFYVKLLPFCFTLLGKGLYFLWNNFLFFVYNYGKKKYRKAFSKFWFGFFFEKLIVDFLVNNFYWFAYNCFYKNIECSFFQRNYIFFFEKNILYWYFFFKMLSKGYFFVYILLVLLFIFLFFYLYFIFYFMAFPLIALVVSLLIYGFVGKGKGIKMFIKKNFLKL